MDKTGEIEKIANIYCVEKANIGESHDFTSYVDGYTQCQEDTSDKKYTDDDLRKAFYYGGKSAIDEYGTFEDFINSLNKQ